MKTKIYLLILATILGFGKLNAAIITVDNNTVVSGSPGQFVDLQAACTAALAGDTILVVGSQTKYGDISITKKLILLGPGVNPQRPNTNTAKIQLFRINNGASNSTISGFYFDYGVDFNNSIIVQNITISKNFIANYATGSVKINGYPASGISFFNNIIGGYCYLGNNPNIFISNNIFYQNAKISNSNKASVSIKNNLFLGGGVAIENVENAEISNNICIGKYSFNNVGLCTFNNNLIYDLYNFPSPYELPFGTNIGSGNLINQDPAFLKREGDFSLTNNYGLQNSSPCKNTGTDGTDIGPSGGSYPFTNTFPLTAMPSIPVITQMQINGASAVPFGNSNINVTVKAKKQN